MPSDFEHMILDTILANEQDFESALDEDLITRIVNNIFSLASMISSMDDGRFKAQALGAPVAGLLTLDTITAGNFSRDDQYNGVQIFVTSGSASGAGVNSRFPITDCDEGAQTFTCGDNGLGEDLQAAGMGDNDTFVILGHSHNGSDSEKIDIEDLDQTNSTIGIKDYSEAGRSQSVSSTDSITITITHTFVNLPTGDNLIFGWFELQLVGASGGNLGFTKLTVNGKNLEIKQGFNDTQAKWPAGGGFNAKVQNGDTIVIEVNGGSSGPHSVGATGNFEIWAYQRVIA